MPTAASKPRSIAYFTSAEVTSRFTGGLNLMPFRMWTVIVLPSFEMVGIADARSGTGWMLFGLYASSGRCVTYVIAYVNW